MAKNAGLKRKDDKFILKVMIVFAVVFTALIASLLIYNAVKVTYNYEDFDMVTDFGAMTSQEEDKYLLYYYSESCYFFKIFKDDVLAFA